MCFETQRLVLSKSEKLHKSKQASWATLYMRRFKQFSRRQKHTILNMNSCALMSLQRNSSKTHFKKSRCSGWSNSEFSSKTIIQTLAIIFSDKDCRATSWSPNLSPFASAAQFGPLLRIHVKSVLTAKLSFTLFACDSIPTFDVSTARKLSPRNLFTAILESWCRRPRNKHKACQKKGRKLRNSSKPNRSAQSLIKLSKASAKTPQRSFKTTST